MKSQVSFFRVPLGDTESRYMEDRYSTDDETWSARIAGSVDEWRHKLT